MRTLVLTALLVTSVIALPGASAKAFAEDATGDTQTEVFGAPVIPASMPSADAADLVSLDLAETAEDMTFTLKVAGFSGAVSTSDYAIYFTWAKDEYVVRAFRQIIQGVAEESTNAYIMNLESEDSFDTLANLEHEVDAASGLFTIHLPKAYLLDERGRYPTLGDELKDVYVRSRSQTTLFNFGFASADRMPDGEDALKYAFVYGDLAKGHLRIDADDRVRVSNGGATTFVYKVVVTNTGEIDDEVSLTLGEMPEGWNGTVQSPIRIPGGAERSVAVLVSVPFAHEHGGFSSFNLSAKSDRDANSLAAIRMGVLHTPIPQPAGHHADLYLHAENFNGGLFGDLFPWRGGTMNTDSVHDTDAPEATIWGANGGEGYSWRIPLDPILRMGLDFDLDRVGELTGSVIGRSNSAGQFRAELELVQTLDDEAEGVIIAESNSVDGVFDLQNPTPFTLTITPLPEAEYIPYAKGQNLVLWLYFESEDVNFCCIGGQTAPGLQTETFKMTLPLNEYHDKLTGFTDSLDSLSLKAEGPVEKIGLPGTTMTYSFTLTNNGAEDQVIDLDLAGTDALLGTLVPDDVIELGSKESRKLTLAVRIPAEKNDGEELEVLVFAHAQEDPSKSAIARTKTVVGKTGSQELVADETAVLAAAQDAEQNDAPAPGAIFALAAVGVAALLMRRRK